MSADVVYVDSSALVKLVVAEPESEALAAHLRDRPRLASCALARVEIVRAVCAHGAEAVRRARLLLGHVALLRIDDALLDAAADLEPLALRSLDALHLAAAGALGPSLEEVVTYDSRMRAAAERLGFLARAPA